MQSLSEILKQMPKESLKSIEQKRAALLSHPLIEEFKKKYPQLKDSELSLHLNLLLEFVQEYEHCTNCPGLDLCPNNMKGHYTRLSVEKVNEQRMIYDHKVACRKFRARQSQEAIQNRIKSFYIDERALSKGYSADDIISIDKDRTKSAAQVLEYIVKTKKQGLQHKGLYLVGSFGTGKTFLMCYMLYELAKSGYTGAIVYVPDFIEELKGMFQAPEKLKETVEMLKETDLLIFDDIGAENLNPWARDHILGAILNYRMNRKPTFYTSNYDLEAMEKHFSFTNKDGDEEYKGQRIMDRIRPFVDVLFVKGENKRGKM